MPSLHPAAPDFERMLPRLDGPRWQWLHDALGLAHPGHPWMTALADRKGL